MGVDATRDAVRVGIGAGFGVGIVGMAMGAVVGATVLCCIPTMCVGVVTATGDGVDLVAVEAGAKTRAGAERHQEDQAAYADQGQAWRNL